MLLIYTGQSIFTRNALDMMSEYWYDVINCEIIKKMQNKMWIMQNFISRYVSAMK